MFGEFFPMLSSREPERLFRFYQIVFDAAEAYRFPVDSSDEDVEYVALRVGSSSLGIGRVREAPGAEAGRGRVALWSYTDDCDTVVERARHNNARIIAEPSDQPWGERLGVFSDPDGNEIYVGQENTKGEDLSTAPADS